MPEKMRLKCSSCGTWFKASGYKRTLCPSCFAKAEKARAAVKSHAAPAKPALPAAPSTVAPQASPPREAPRPPSAPVRGGDVVRPMTAMVERGSPPARPPRQGARPPGGPAARPQQVAAQAPRLPATPTLEQAAAIERRYKELAQPVEFDGIRSRIAEELGVPKSVVKRVVKEYRERLHLPSWWDVSHQPLTPAQVELVRQRYEPLLPLPPIGVHHTLAQELGLSGWAVYQAIGQIRQQLGLTRYNEREDAPRRHEQSEKQPQDQSSSATTSVVA